MHIICFDNTFVSTDAKTATELAALAVNQALWDWRLSTHGLDRGADSYQHWTGKTLIFRYGGSLFSSVEGHISVGLNEIEVASNSKKFVSFVSRQLGYVEKATPAVAPAPSVTKAVRETSGVPELQPAS